MNRVVVTGLGVVAPNAPDKSSFLDALKSGKSGLRYVPKLAEHKFGCRVAGIPEYSDDQPSHRPQESNNTFMQFGETAVLAAWRDAGLEIPDETNEQILWNSGAILGTGFGGLDTVAREVVPLTNAKRVRRLDRNTIERIIPNGVAVRAAYLLGLGNRVSTNCGVANTGTAAIAEAARWIRHGYANRMLAGGIEGVSIYTWAGFDAKGMLNRRHNDTPDQASRPMSADATGFVPAAGAGILVLEDEKIARERGARIYAEIIGVAHSAGGRANHRQSQTLEVESIAHCIKLALDDAKISGGQVDAINGNLIGAPEDVQEIFAWRRALGVNDDNMPFINATKSLIGHGLGAAGGMESAASVLQIHHEFLHPSKNCERLDEALKPVENRIVRKTKSNEKVGIMAKGNFGSGGLNTCLLLQAWRE